MTLDPANFPRGYPECQPVAGFDERDHVTPSVRQRRHRAENEYSAVSADIASQVTTLLLE